MIACDVLPCLVCDQPLPIDVTARCLTDCSHEFCLSCLCQHLAPNKNQCPGCHVQVKRVTQLREADAPRAAFVRFRNTVYVLNVSIWAVDDPANVLASLFNLYVMCDINFEIPVADCNRTVDCKPLQKAGETDSSRKSAQEGRHMAWIGSAALWDPQGGTADHSSSSSNRRLPDVAPLRVATPSETSRVLSVQCSR